MRRILIIASLAVSLVGGAAVAVAGSADPDPGAPYKVQLVYDMDGKRHVQTYATVDTLDEAAEAIVDLTARLGNSDTDEGWLLTNGHVARWHIRPTG